jgi:hypothetical protein
MYAGLVGAVLMSLKIASLVIKPVDRRRPYILRYRLKRVRGGE